MAKTVELKGKDLFIDGVRIEGCARAEVFGGRRGGVRLLLDVDAERFLHNGSPVSGIDHATIDIPSGSCAYTSTLNLDELGLEAGPVCLDDLDPVGATIV